MRISALTLLLLVWMSCSHPSVIFAWSGGGHMVIAAEAYQEIPRGTRKEIDQILKSHPSYQHWRANFKSDSPNVDLPLYVFMKASTWPDEIRGKESEYDHPHWHYVDYPLKPPSFKFVDRPAPDDDALYAISYSEKMLSESKNRMEQAVYIAWLIHLIGDLHQPLHCASLINEQYPSGDKGGNDFYVKPAGKGIKLHGYWDNLIGTRTDPQSRFNAAIKIRKAHSWLWLTEFKIKTPKDWSLESRDLAIERGYLRGKLRGSQNPDNAPSLPSSYAVKAKKVAEKQAALAGYRLAHKLRDCVK